jgi:hypothetical protein
MRGLHNGRKLDAMRRLVPFLALLLAAAPALADARLVLKDGTVLAGRSVQRKDDLYLLDSGHGSIVPVPAELVAQLQLVESESAPTGIEPTGPKSLAGPAWAGATPPFREQVAAFGKSPYVAPLPAVDPIWKPATDWTEEGKAALMPVRWSYGPLDAAWTPKSAYTKAGEVSGFHPARWFSSPVNPVWQPIDGWGQTAWFRPLVAPAE